MKQTCSAAGNRFVTWNVDLEDVAPADGPLAVAETRALGLCSEHQVDGVIAFGCSAGSADLRVTFFNSDGSRPEACGNGLRAAARYARERGWVSSDELLFETDAGDREARLLREANAICAAEVGLGKALDHGDVALSFESPELPVAEITVAHVELGNPHAVLFVADPTLEPVGVLGAAIERHARFPGRINVGFASAHSRGLKLRVWERGVGETRACGTGAAAAALAAVNRGHAQWPVAVDLPGGALVVRAGGAGELWLTGPC